MHTSDKIVRRRAPETIKCGACGAATFEGKPYCIDHLENVSDYVKSIIYADKRTFAESDILAYLDSNSAASLSTLRCKLKLTQIGPIIKRMIAQGVLVERLLINPRTGRRVTVVIRRLDHAV